MSLCEVLRGDMQLGDLALLYDAPFEIANSDFDLIHAIGERRRHHDGTYRHFDNAVESTLFLAHVYHGLARIGCAPELLAAYRRSADTFVRLHVEHPNPNTEAWGACISEVLEEVTPLLQGQALEQFRRAFSESGEYFLALRDRLVQQYDVHDDRLQSLGHNLGYGWSRPMMSYATIWDEVYAVLFATPKPSAAR